ncbi:MAG TPA: branched-chain amino acid ABC transporter permease [Ktedonobacterales bacterium]|jgi:branched-chain amino acid transport system permease protein|nr:branched-chain amino acid ABC transporter permease [Ktedonobacterales bacterium]
MHVLALASAQSSALGYLLQQLEIGITRGALYALIALGYTLVYGIIELINFAHGDVFMWGTIVTLVLVQAMGLNGPVTGFALVGVLILLVVVGMLVCGVLNVTIERLAYRPLRRAPRLAPLIAAIGVSFILENVAQLWRGSEFVAFPSLLGGGFSLGGVQINAVDIFIIALALGLMYGLDRFIRVTRLGRAMRATAQDPEAAALMGVSIDRTIALTFLIGGALAGAGAVVYNLNAGQVQFLIGFQLGLIAFTAAVLGGIGNINGAVLGGFVIGIVEALSIAYIPNGIGWSEVVIFSILVLILVFRPSGLLGAQVPDKV